MTNTQKIDTRDWADIVASNLHGCQIISGRDVERVAKQFREAAADQGAAAKEVHRVTNQRYADLLLAVDRKFDGETRHETALRYIRETEANCCRGPTQEATATCPVCDGGPGNNCACSCPKG